MKDDFSEDAYKDGWRLGNQMKIRRNLYSNGYIAYRTIDGRWRFRMFKFKMKRRNFGSHFSLVYRMRILRQADVATETQQVYTFRRCLNHASNVGWRFGKELIGIARWRCMNFEMVSTYIEVWMRSIKYYF